MDIIQNYLDALFSAYPTTPEMKRAKEELLAMMEDKYNELIREGHNQNEAVGIVMAEFGNVEEILRDLDGEDKSQEENERSRGEEGIHGVTYQEAVEYIQIMEKISSKIGLGVWLCMASPTVLLILMGFKEINGMPNAVVIALGVSMLFVCIAVAVSLFIYSGLRIQRYDVWKKEIFWMDQETKRYVESLREAFQSTFVANLIVGIVICIVSFIPVIIGPMLGKGSAAVMLPSLGITLLFAGLGVFFFVVAGLKQSCYTVLLQEKEYTQEKKDKSKRSLGKYEDSYWIMVTAIYFLISFWTRKWGITWIIWIFAAGIYNIIKMKKR